jgi:peptidoglycan hydrolase-like protein with peptidoglycan-binding domain
MVLWGKYFLGLYWFYQQNKKKCFRKLNFSLENNVLSSKYIRHIKKYMRRYFCNLIFLNTNIMFSFYKKLFFTPIVSYYAPGPEGFNVADSLIPEERPENLELRAKLQEIAQDGMVEGGELQEALNIIGEEVSEWERIMVLEMFENLWTKLAGTGVVEAKWIIWENKDAIVYDKNGNFKWWGETDLVTYHAMSKLTEKLWLSMDDVIVALQKWNNLTREENQKIAQMITEVWQSQRGATAKEMREHASNQNEAAMAAREAAVDEGIQRLADFRETEENARIAQNEASDNQLIERAEAEAKANVIAGLENAARDLADKFNPAQFASFESLDGTIKTAFVPRVGGVDLNLPGIWKWEDVIDWAQYAAAIDAWLSKDEIVSIIQTALTQDMQSSRSIYMANLKQTGGDASSAEEIATQNKIDEWYREYAESRIQGEKMRIAQDQNNAADAQLIAQAEAHEMQKVDESIQTALNLLAWEAIDGIKFSKIAWSNELTEATQSIILSELWIDKVREVTWNPDWGLADIIDGIYGTGTEKMVAAYQEKIWLWTDGKFWKDTFASLKDSPTLGSAYIIAQNFHHTPDSATA